MVSSEQRTELASFLRTRRSQLSPADVGLPRTARRKTAGLRREEVAQLAGVGVTWYTWLEQGRDINVSTQVLDSLAQTFRLTTAEKIHLYLLAGQPSPAHPVPPSEYVSPFLHRFLEEIGRNNPAYITGRRWDVLAWNRAACQVLADFDTMPVEERNIVRLLFTNEEYRRRSRDWEAVARRVLAQLRVSSGLYRNDPQLRALIADLQQRSSEFARWWPRHDVQERREGRKEFFHPHVGSLVFDHDTFQIEDAPGLKMVVYLPADEETARKLTQLAMSESSFTH
ncbi:helix-turn-helix transcriptional regulator [Dictyobacter aurantiacus]|uniref:Transcriptional regulator n=1 Tax=Dictyobacter aurantiacus TaxID=1936993 RepID=A0A401ZRS4_9CHLR|nr:helix-turn-helix transcriptional regulator [Dictyobacter aurantiacus]GCE09589.1 transcriptional regulator [Dictyobacter aurantiacus]